MWATGWQEQRRCASVSQVPASSSYRYARRSPSSTPLRHGPYAHPPDVNFGQPIHTPLARLNMFLQNQVDKGKTINIMTIAKRMKEDGFRPDLTTYNSILQACAWEKCQDEARAVFADMLSMGVQPDRQTFHLLIQTSHSADQSVLVEVLKTMEEWSILPNETTYEIMISRFSANNRLELALQSLSQLARDGLSPTLTTASEVIRCAAKLGFSRLALDLADAFESTSVRRLDSDVWVDILASSAEELYVEGTRRAWHEVVSKQNILPDEGCCLLVLHTAARHGLSGLALEVIETLKRLNIVWHEHHIAPVIEAMCYHGELKEAFMMFEFMRKHGITHTIETALPVLEIVKKDSDAVDSAWGTLEELHEEGHTIDITAFNVVIHAAVALQDLQRAIGTYKAAAQLNVKPDILTFNTLLEGCVAARHRDLGDRLLSDMKELGVRPDTTTYERMVRLCLTQSMYEDAFFYLEEMKSLGLVPPLLVYEAIIRKLVAVGDTRYNLALEELKECGYEVSVKLQSFISSGGAHNGPANAQSREQPVVRL
ncbi:hypothetical protein C8Q80DRAFT_1091740 [Daedaleopsis nitida]|nr:hypothetical protein C8Q80DRAFT_1091740 [Daedaleopsis nitida]